MKPDISCGRDWFTIELRGDKGGSAYRREAGGIQRWRASYVFGGVYSTRTVERHSQVLLENAYHLDVMAFPCVLDALSFIAVEPL